MVTGCEPIICVISSVLSAAGWAALIGRRITDVTHICKYVRAAMLGVAIGWLTALSVAIFLCAELKWEIMINGQQAVEQTVRYVVMATLVSNPHLVLLILHAIGAYFGIIGAIGGLFLRWLRTLYELDEAMEEYEGDDRPSLRSDDE